MDWLKTDNYLALRSICKWDTKVTYAGRLRLTGINALQLIQLILKLQDQVLLIAKEQREI